MPADSIIADPTWRVAAITSGESVPSRRYRIAELATFLEDVSVRMEEFCPAFSSYPPTNRLYRIPWFAAAILERTTYLARVRNYDAVILQRELISTIATLERWLPEPLIFDIDDAIFMRRNGAAAKRISSRSSLIVCGNAYLAEKFSKWNRNTAIIPNRSEYGVA